MGGFEDEGAGSASHSAPSPSMTDQQKDTDPSPHPAISTPDTTHQGNEDSIDAIKNDIATSLEPKGSRSARVSATEATLVKSQEDGAVDREGSPAESDKETNGGRGYGTRSRNRTGTTRINYAEDVDMDFERTNGVEQTTTGHPSSSPTNPPSNKTAKRPWGARDPSSSPLNAPSPSPEVAVQTKRSSTTTNGHNPSIEAPSIPGTSTFSANPVPAPSRKRKAQAMQNVTVNGSAPAVASAHAPSTASRRNGTQANTSNFRGNGMYSFDRSKAIVKNGKLVADDGTAFAINDCVYLVCEPPGDPYYIGRIMEFRHRKTEDPTTPVESLRMNWSYRARDTARFTTDSRLLYATMHSDVCPLTSLRGKCKVTHRSDIKDLDEYRRQPDSFWYNQCFDRFIHRFYEVVPVSQIINVPTNVKAALDDRWKFVVLEATRVKELTSAVKLCKRCTVYCANPESVDCAICNNSYHMNCVRPPLLKKPARGFAWACGPCSRAQERKLEARRTPNISEMGTEPEEEEVVEEEDPMAGIETGPNSPKEAEDRPPTQAEVAHAKMWPMRYLGIHCRVEDALQYDDRAIYPRASSRIGTKHQATTLDWVGRPLELVKPKEIKRRYIKTPGNKKDTKLTKETIAALEADKIERANRPKWVQDEPVGYVHRGEDKPNKDSTNTAKLMFTMPAFGELSERGSDDDRAPVDEKTVDAYMQRTKTVAKDLGVQPWSTDFLDRATFLFSEYSYDADAAIKELKKTYVVGSWPKNRLEIRKDLRDPRFTLNKEEAKRFAEGVAQYGSELRLVRQHVETVPHGDIVRYWYYWKKTPQGRQVWGAYGGRKGSRKKQEAEVPTKLQDDIADDQDDSAFDNEKVMARQRKMTCKFCRARRSRIWRRAPGVAPGQTIMGDAKSKDRHEKLTLALCQRCVRLWRHYGVQWEDCDEASKKILQAGSRSWKRHIEEELLHDWEFAQANPELEARRLEASPPPTSAPEPQRKKLKGMETPAAEVNGVKKKPVPAPPPPPKEPTPPPPPIVPNQPKFRQFPCAICACLDIPSNPLVMCRGCRMTVHQTCYGVQDARITSDKFWCDMCANDALQSGAPMPGSLATSIAEPASYDYQCRLCPIEVRNVDLIEPPKVTHKKKTERDREKERLEKELAVELLTSYRKSQIEKGRPEIPREALKRTADNNWIHSICAIFTPEIKFSNPATMEVAEGIPAIPEARWNEKCTICKATSGGACISCNLCHATFHVGCASSANYVFGFDVTPVKGSRRDSVSIVSLGAETGTVVAAVWCKSHEGSIKTIVHPMQEQAEESGPTALALYIKNCKQADLGLTGTMRKANLLDEVNKPSAAVAALPVTSRRISTALTNGRAGRNSISNAPAQLENGTRQSTPRSQTVDRHCVHCEVDTSPRWFPYKSSIEDLKTSARDGDDVKDEHPQAGSNAMEIDGLRINGVRSSRSPAPEDSASHAETVECFKCHWQRINEPGVFKAKREPPAPEVKPYSNHQDRDLRHPMANLGYGHGPAPLPPSQHHPPPQQHAGWPAPSYMNGGVNGYPPPMAIHHPHQIYHAPVPPGPPPGHVAYAIAIPPIAHYAQGAPPPHHHIPPQAAAPMSNGHHSPSMHMHSPSQPGAPQLPPPPAHMSPYPPPHPGHSYSGYGPPPAQHHGSPLPGGPPPMAMHTGGSSTTQPTTPRDNPAILASGSSRIPHGASASPSVRNLLDD